MIAVAVVTDENPEIREEDYAATMMGIENLAIAAVEMGLGTAMKTGAIMSDPAARGTVGVRDDERIIAVVNLGEPADVPPPKKREPASTYTTWVP
jgi:nitroreductase